MDNAKFHRDERVIAARKQYRANLRVGMPERAAWAIANTVFGTVRAEQCPHVLTFCGAVVAPCANHPMTG